MKHFPTLSIRKRLIVFAAIVSATLPTDVFATGETSGTSPESVPPAQLRHVSELPSDILELRKGLGVCHPFNDLTGRDHFLHVEDPKAFSQVFIVPCAGGGYNLSFVVFIESGGETVAHAFKTYELSGQWDSTREVYNAEWIAERRVLVTFRKGRSLGDCGAIAEWRYENGALHLESYFFEPNCDDSSQPGVFPLLTDSP